MTRAVTTVTRQTTMRELEALFEKFQFFPSSRRRKDMLGSATRVLCWPPMLFCESRNFAYIEAARCAFSQIADSHRSSVKGFPLGGTSEFSTAAPARIGELLYLTGSSPMRSQQLLLMRQPRANARAVA
jgi:hypothetical protein